VKLRRRQPDLARTTFAEVFPFGPAPTLIFLVTIVTGLLVWGPVGLEAVGVSTRWLPESLEPPGRQEADLSMMTFASPHYDAYIDALRASERYALTQDLPTDAARRAAQQQGRTVVNLSLVNANAVSRKLQAAFRAGINVADVIEVENTRAGTFFRGPVERIPFHDIGALLRRTTDERGVSLYDRMVKNRFALYSHQGTIYGLPHDLHPVLIAYRRDIFEAERDRILRETGIDPLGGQLTWPQFVRIGQVLTEPGRRYMLQVSDRNVGSFEVFLYQRGGDFFDAEGNVTFDSSIALEVLQWMIPLVAGGPGERIFDDAGGGGPAFYRSLAEGYVLAFLCPDWRTGVVESNAPNLAGKLALMPMPVWPNDPEQRRTSTWGGTMLGLTRQSAGEKQAAWEMAQALYFNIDLLAEQFGKTNIIPPFKDAWDHPVFHQPRPYWSGQVLGEQFIEVADDVPPRTGHPFLELAKSKVGAVIASCANYYRSYGAEGFDAFAERRLKEAAEDVRQQMQRNPF